MTKEQKKARQGQNKARKFGKVKDELDLCWKIANGSICEFGAELSFFLIIFRSVILVQALAQRNTADMQTLLVLFFFHIYWKLTDAF